VGKRNLRLTSDLPKGYPYYPGGMGTSPDYSPRFEFQKIKKISDFTRAYFQLKTN
jgi:hypothetical protein